MTNAGGEFLRIPASMGRRAQQVRPENDPRLNEVTGFDHRHPWMRSSVKGIFGYARLHPVHRHLAQFVPDDGEERLLPATAVGFILSRAEAPVVTRATLREARQLKGFRPGKTRTRRSGASPLGPERNACVLCRVRRDHPDHEEVHATAVAFAEDRRMAVHVEGRLDWWAKVLPGGEVQHVLVPARVVRESTIVRDLGGERHARQVARKRARILPKP